MRILLPEILEAERTPLVRQLLDIIALQQQRIQQLEERVDQLQDEIAHLKGLKARPRIAPSTLERPPGPPRDPKAKRPGSAKRPKTALLTVTDEVVVPLPDVPREAVFKGYEDFVVQDLILRPRVIRYRRERWLTPEGQSLVAPLPGAVLRDTGVDHSGSGHRGRLTNSRQDHAAQLPGLRGAAPRAHRHV